MKNKLTLDIDSERENIIIFGKPESDGIPATKEEEKILVDTDIKSLIAALVELIHYAGDNELGFKEEYKQFALETINNIK